MALSRYPSGRRGSWPTPSGMDWNDFFPGLMAPGSFHRNVSTGAAAPVDVCERENEFIIRVACAGCRPEDIDVTVEEDTVRIRGRFPDHEHGMSQEQSGQMQGGTAGQTSSSAAGTSSQAQTSQSSGSQAQGQSSGVHMAGQSHGQSSSAQMSGQSSGQNAQTNQAPREQCLVRELPTGRFERDITLPMAVDSRDAQANFENGLLTLTLPKARAQQGHRIQIGQGQSQAHSTQTQGTGAM